LDEVVVVGYGTQKKINLTGAVDVVSSEELANRPVTNVTEALQGVSPNLNIVSNGWDGEPGGSKSINIRGMGSLNGNDGPYVLVDGVPMDLNTVNPNDIESFSILKDAAASAIYGSKAAFGVILITTKKGERNKLKVNYSNNFSFSSPIGLPHMANSLQYMTAHDQAQVNAGLSPTFTPENYDRVRQYMAGTITDETWVRDDENNWHGNDIWSLGGNGNNDWMYIYYDEMVLRQQHDISFSGGSEKVNFFVAGGFFDQPDELRFGDQYHKRLNFTANLTAEVTDWLTFNFNSKFINIRNQYFNPGQGWTRDVQYHNFYRTNPFRPLYLPNGEYSAISYINEMIDGGKEKHYNNQYITSAGFNFKLAKGWDAKVQYTYKNNSDRMDNTRKEVTLHLPDGTPYPVANGGSSSYFASQFVRNDYQLFNATTSYSKSIQKHNFDLLLGYEFDLNQYNGLYGRKTNLLISNLPAISTATGEITLDDTKNHWGTQGTFGRFSYNFDEKYLLEVNARYDASSRFAKDSRWGFFPSVSAGYNISRENFWEPIQPIVNTLKIRGSWGSLGNQNVDNYLYLSTLGINTNLYWLMNGERPDYITAPGLVSNSLTWETSSTLDIGFDASFLNNKLTATFDYFKRTTSDMFGPANALPSLLGTAIPKLNNATLETNGFELSLGWKDYIGDSFSYNLRFNLSDNVSKITKYNNPTNTLTTWYNGKEVGEIWGLKTNGLYQSQAEADNGADQSLFWPTWGAGDVAYRDLDGDNIITKGTWTKGDSGDYSVIGNSTPRFNYGISGGADWKGFDLNFLLQGVGKRDYAFVASDANFYGFNANSWWDMNVYKQTVNYWRPADETNELGPNTSGYYPKPYLSLEDRKNKEISSRYMQDASYMRLKNVTLGYSFSSDILKNSGVSNARLYISGENLLTFTKLTSLMDPEGLSTLSTGWGVGKIHPLRKVYAIGLNITF
ncbi:MAG TPA: TonB-dependent receptor, partial [Arenibacter sp.]|nr:TonB-dependent receptor [Arenibacter sp.]